MASSRSEEIVNFKHFQHLKVSQCWSVLQFYFGHFDLGCLADVIANVCFSHSLLFGRCYCHLQFFVVDVKSLVLCHVWLDWHVGRCYCHSFLWLMWLSHFVIVLCDWCYCHLLLLIFVTDVIVTLMLVYCLADVVLCGVVPPSLVARGYFLLAHGWCYCHWPEQHQNKLVHGSPIPSRTQWENKEDMQHIWGSGVL